MMVDAENPDKSGIRVFLHPEAEEPVEIHWDNFKLRDDQLPNFMRANIRRRANR